MGAAWERHAMCESAFSWTFLRYLYTGHVAYILSSEFYFFFTLYMLLGCFGVIILKLWACIGT